MTKLIRQNPPRKRVQLKIPEASITDQTVANDFSMASIKKRLEKQIPINNLTHDAFYSLEPLQYTNLQDALNFHDQVQQTFESLPIELRKDMGHNIHNFEKYLNDPNNQQKLEKYGLIIKRDAKNSDVIEAINKLKPEAAPILPSDKQKQP